MPTVKGGCRAEENGTISFGDYTLKDKLKVNDFAAFGDVFNVRTHNLVTRLEKNGNLLFESVPGAAIFNFKEDERGCSFSACGAGVVTVTLELLPETTYAITAGGEKKGEIAANKSGKISIKLELDDSEKAVCARRTDG